MESTSPPLMPGETVQVTADAIGVLDPAAEGRPAFHPDVMLSKGDKVSYAGPAPDVGEGEWHLVTADVGGVTYTAPVHESMFARIE